LPKPTDPLSRQRPWISLGISAALHAALLALAVHLTREPLQPPADHSPQPADPAREVQMVYLPPPPAVKTPPPAPEPPPPTPPPPPPQQQPPPQPPPPRSAPPPPKEQRTPEPDANAPPEATRAEGQEPETDDPAGGERTGANDPKEGSPAPATEDAPATMESEARRIFGRPRLGTRPGAGPRAVRPMEAYLPDRPERCVPKPAAPRDSAAEPQYGVVRGKIFRQDNGRPLAGAHLQMLGTPFVSFTSDDGEYRFRFDLSLVDNCRTQYVRVTAPGYESRLLVLMVGPNIRSDDVLLKRR
jgi:outer membrane biosynthesis protein TonB